VRRSNRRCRRTHCGIRRIKTTTTIRKVIVISRTEKKIIRRFARVEARTQCGRGHVNKACRREVIQQVIERESSWRKTTLRACACRSRAATKCNKRTGKCFRRSVRRCRRACLRSGCRTRATTECSTRTEKGCVRRVTRVCRRVHCPRRRVIIRTHRRHTHVRRTIKQTTLRNYARRTAIKKCGRGAENKACRRQVIAQVIERETTWRQTTLKGCHCRSTAVTKCSSEAGKCVTRKTSTCRNRCLRRAIKVRVTDVCTQRSTTGAERRTCIRTRTQRLVRVHCGRRTIGVVRTSVVRTTVIKTQTTHHTHTTQVHHVRQVVTQRTVTATTVITKVIDTRVIDKFAVRIAERKCEEDDTECINKVRQQAIDRETLFRRNALKACKCISAAATRCNKRSGRCFRRRLYRCRSRCLRRACRTRARTACNGKRRCTRRRARRCVRLHLKISRRYALWRKAARRVAIRKCGKSAEKKVCRQQVIIQFFEREQSFRNKALNACNCVSVAKTKCNKASGRCFTRRHRRCRRRCLRRAIKARAQARCASRTTGVRRCVRRSTRRLVRLHCGSTTVVQTTVVRSTTVVSH
jgi:hypothetical protein